MLRFLLEHEKVLRDCLLPAVRVGACGVRGSGGAAAGLEGGLFDQPEPAPRVLCTSLEFSTHITPGGWTIDRSELKMRYYQEFRPRWANARVGGEVDDQDLTIAGRAQ